TQHQPAVHPFGLLGTITQKIVNRFLGAASGILGILGLPNLREIRSKFKEQAAADLARKNSPTGLLFKHVKS
ncbi:hypothetical protein VC290_21415, partial [Xanthomonas campestris]|uniref:hypothetical protein n=1 Tax=Xanthomonas campestris TaxID=339 RepID=UPI002B235028